MAFRCFGLCTMFSKVTLDVGVVVGRTTSCLKLGGLRPTLTVTARGLWIMYAR